MLALAAGLSACADEVGTAVFLPTTLQPGTWYLHEANGDTLPALIAERFVGIASEQTYLDSATVTIGAGGTWEQRIHLRVLVSDALDREELMFDRGTWAAQVIGFSFVSDLRSRAFTGTLAFGTLLSTTEPVLAWASAPSVAGSYYQTAP